MVIPCYNEQHRLRTDIFSHYLRLKKERCFLFVNDGSKDATERILRKLTGSFPDSVRMLSLPKNGGKAEAVRQGMLAASSWQDFDLYGFMDADLSTPLEEIDRFASILAKNPDTHMIMGSRYMPDALVEGRNVIINMAGRLFGKVVSGLLGRKFLDTQCGFKLFRPVVIRLFNEPFRFKWIFDVELINRLQITSIHRKSKDLIIEYPVLLWTQKGGTKINSAKKIWSFVLFVLTVALNLEPFRRK